MLVDYSKTKADVKNHQECASEKSDRRNNDLFDHRNTSFPCIRRDASQRSFASLLSSGSVRINRGTGSAAPFRPLELDTPSLCSHGTEEAKCWSNSDSLCPSSCLTPVSNVSFRIRRRSIVRDAAPSGGTTSSSYENLQKGVRNLIQAEAESNKPSNPGPGLRRSSTDPEGQEKTLADRRQRYATTRRSMSLYAKSCAPPPTSLPRKGCLVKPKTVSVGDFLASSLSTDYSSDDDSLSDASTISSVASFAGDEDDTSESSGEDYKKVGATARADCTEETRIHLVLQGLDSSDRTEDRQGTTTEVAVKRPQRTRDISDPSDSFGSSDQEVDGSPPKPRSWLQMPQDAKRERPEPPAKSFHRRTPSNSSTLSMAKRRGSLSSNDMLSLLMQQPNRTSGKACVPRTGLLADSRSSSFKNKKCSSACRPPRRRSLNTSDLASLLVDPQNKAAATWPKTESKSEGSQEGADSIAATEHHPRRANRRRRLAGTRSHSLSSTTACRRSGLASTRSQSCRSLHSTSSTGNGESDKVRSQLRRRASFRNIMAAPERGGPCKKGTNRTNDMSHFVTGTRIRRLSVGNALRQPA